MKVIKGDTILVIAGKDKGKVAKILKSLPKEGRILVEGVNLRKKHVKPKSQGEKGQVVSAPATMNVSNVKLLCPRCGKPARVGYKVENDKKVRICKKCKSVI